MIQAEFQRSFEKLGVKPIDTVEHNFNPALHDAVAQETSTTVPEGQIIRQWKPGYLIGDKVLRVATVVVSSGPPVSQNDATDVEKNEI